MTHEHPMTLLVNADNDLHTPIRFCLECGMVMFCFENPYVMIPEWSKKKLQQFEKETLKIVPETKPRARPKQVLGRGLKDLMNAPSAGIGLSKLFEKN